MAGERYEIRTIEDMRKVPVERRAAMLRDLEVAFLTHDVAYAGFGDQAPITSMVWTDDGDASATITANGEKLFELRVTEEGAS